MPTSSYRPPSAMGYSASPRQARQPTLGRQPSLQRRNAQAVRPNRSHRSLWVAAACLLVVFGIHVLLNHRAAAHALAVRQATAAQLAARASRIQNLDIQLSQLIAASPQLSLSVSLQEVDSAHASSQKNFGVSDVFDAASTAKLLTASDYLHQVEAGQASLSQTIDGVSAEHLLQRMIVNSDDTAWVSLNDYLTHASLSRYAKQLGLSNYDVTTNELSAGDITALLAQLSQGKLLNTSDTKLLLGYMKQANYRSYIVPAVAQGDTVYHKVGIDNDTVNDAAIIKQGDQTLVLTIFTDGHGTYDWPDRATLMQTITKDVTAAYFL